jgi:predicted glutamine amidotransferase
MTKHDASNLGGIITKAWAAMSSTEKDGFGAAWVSPNGKIGYVKSSHPTLLPSLPDFCAAFSDGNGLKSDGGALIIHGRTATCGVNVGNTHPMLDDNRALIHNGVVSSKRYHNINTTCDSELILQAWKCAGISSVSKDITGYYALGIIERMRGKTILSVVRDNQAKLVVGKKDDAWVFATNTNLLTSLAVPYVSEFRTNTVATFVNGVSTCVESFIPAEPDRRLEKAANVAFGHNNHYVRELRGHYGEQLSLD